MTDERLNPEAAVGGLPVPTRPPQGGASFASGAGWDEVAHVLREIQRRGGIGRGPVETAMQHALAYVDRLPSLAGTLVDLGSGGGLPGLVIAAAAPEWELHLVERRLKRADLLSYGVRALELGERVHVHGEDTVRFVPRHRAIAEVVSARSFAPPLVVLQTARPLLRHGGAVLISDPPDGLPRWTPADLASLALVDDGAVAGIRRVRDLVPAP